MPYRSSSPSIAVVGFDGSFFFFSSRRRHTRLQGDWSSDVCSSDLLQEVALGFIADDAADGFGRILRNDVAVLVLEAVHDHGAHEDAFVGDGAHGVRSEERRVGKECRSRWSPYH